MSTDGRAQMLPQASFLIAQVRNSRSETVGVPIEFASNTKHFWWPSPKIFLFPNRMPLGYLTLEPYPEEWPVFGFKTLNVNRQGDSSLLVVKHEKGKPHWNFFSPTATKYLWKSTLEGTPSSLRKIWELIACLEHVEIHEILFRALKWEVKNHPENPRNPFKTTSKAFKNLTKNIQNLYETSLFPVFFGFPQAFERCSAVATRSTATATPAWAAPWRPPVATWPSGWSWRCGRCNTWEAELKSHPPLKEEMQGVAQHLAGP